jgi:hypothetical protein
LKTAPDWRLLSQNCCCLHFIGDKIQTLAEIEANWLKKKKNLLFLYCLHFIGDKITHRVAWRGRGDGDTTRHFEKLQNAIKNTL